MSRRFATFFTLLTIAALGCHAQVPPATSHVVNLTWTAPAANANWGGCTTASPCVYAVYRCTVSSGCSDLTQATWKEITTAATRPSTLAFTDSTAAGSLDYIVETVQGGANSAASNTTQVTVPGTPTAPPLNTPSVAQNEPLSTPLVHPAIDLSPQLAHLTAPSPRPGRVVLRAMAGH